VHAPELHWSVCVQALPSLHALPSLFTGFEHAPLVGSQLPATWHWSEAAQSTGFAPKHVPALHWSVCVQALPSLHALPSLFTGFEQAPLVGSQLPATWHWSEAAQSTGFAPKQAPALH